MGKRKTYSSKGFSPEEKENFFMISKESAAIAITNRLTATEYRLWHYLMMIDPFADKTSDGEPIYHELPSPAEIASKIGASTKAVQRAMHRLQNLGLYDYRIEKWSGFNSTRNKVKHGNGSGPSELNSSNGTKLSPSELNSSIGTKLSPSELNSSNGTKLSPSELNSSNGSLKPLPRANSKIPHTIQTLNTELTNFKQTNTDKYDLDVLTFVDVYNLNKPALWVPIDIDAGDLFHEREFNIKQAIKQYGIEMACERLARALAFASANDFWRKDQRDLECLFNNNWLHRLSTRNPEVEAYGGGEKLNEAYKRQQKISRRKARRAEKEAVNGYSKL